jgi:tetratricopeptide (TPR) repeat protein
MNARFALAVVGLVLAAAPVRAAIPAVERARALAAAGERTEARAVLDSLLALPGLDPAERAGAAAERARLEPEGGDYENRLRALLDGEKDPAREAALRLALGKVLFAKGDLAGALREFGESREKGREEEGSLWEGLTAMALGDGPTALEALKRAAGSGNRAIRDRARVALGDAYRLAGNWAEAASQYGQVSQMIEGSPGWWPTAQYGRAQCEEKLEETEEARALYAEILSRAPGSHEAPLARARLRILGAASEQEAAETPPAETAPAPVAGETAPAESLTVQVGAFSLNENAERLAGTVRDGGFGPVRVVKGADGLFRVLVGAFASRDRAEAVGDSLGATLGLGFSVVRAGGD